MLLISNNLCLTVGNWQATPSNFCTFKRIIFSSPEIQFHTWETQRFWNTEEEMTICDKNRPNQPDLIFLSPFCRWVFNESDKIVTKSTIFWCFMYFSGKYDLSLLIKRFRKECEISRMPWFRTFQTDHVVNLQRFGGVQCEFFNIYLPDSRPGRKIQYIFWESVLNF